jgi:hypothetical protein
LLSEREENVKADIFHTFIALLKQTKPSGSVRDDGTGFGANQEIYSLLMQQVPLIIKATSKQMKVMKYFFFFIFTCGTNCFFDPGQEPENSTRCACPFD